MKLMNLSHFQIRNPKDDETPIESATQIFASLLPYPFVPLWRKMLFHPRTYAFEIYLLSQTIYFYIAAPSETDTLIQSLVTASFPSSALKKTTDPMDLVFKSSHIAVGEAVLNNSFYLPTKTYMDFKDIDPLSSLIGFLSKQEPHIKMAIQIAVTPASFPWQSETVEASKKQSYDPVALKYGMNPLKQRILQKASFQGGKAAIRLMVASAKPGVNLLPYLHNLGGTFGSFSLGEGNQYVFHRPLIRKQRLVNKIKERHISYFEHKHQVLNSQELATLWHPPGYLLAGIKNVAWGRTLLGEPPENLPVADGASDETKQEINFFAQTEFKNKNSIFGIKNVDRRRHMYVIGKTGAGKSTLLANMAIDDIRKGRGVGIIDPHGDLCETILEYIPKRRMNDVVYLEPFDTERPFSLNVLEVKNKQQKELVASGIISIFYKIYGDVSWGPRLEYILRNVILTLLETPDSTFIDVLTILTNAEYRKKVVSQLKDPVLVNFWNHEFAKMPDKLKAEAVSPIQNKVGQFVTSRMIRNIIGKPKSSINLEEIMNEGKILLLNLSQGKLGEDSAALLGAMIITQIQLAAMNRSFQKEEDRKDFFLYVDEFQNFATSSFIKILSEARKYRLSLTLANQYIDQLDEKVSKAIFGNVGTIISFVMGARDAYIMTKEYAEIYSENDLVSLGKFETVMKLCIDNLTTAPFPAKTLPLPSVKNENKEKIIRVSKERYGRKV